MKKQLSVAALAVLGLTTAFTHAAPDLVDMNNVFKGTFNFGYTLNQNISVKGFQTDEASSKKTFEVSSPFLKDSKDDAAEAYILVVADKPMKSFQAEGIDLSTEKFVKKSFAVTEEDKMLGALNVKIAPEEVNKDANQFAFLVPLNDNLQEGTPSKEFCFNFAEEKFAEGELCETFGVKAESVLDTIETEDEEHSAAGADMSLAGISHSVKGNVITLTWVKQEASANLEIKLFDKEKADFISLGTVAMDAEKFEYAADPAIQEYIFAFIPKDAKGKEIRYDLNVRTETDVVPTVKPAKVGPVEDMLLMFAVALVLYAGYRVVASRKAE